MRAAGIAAWLCWTTLVSSACGGRASSNTVGGSGSGGGNVSGAITNGGVNATSAGGNGGATQGSSMGGATTRGGTTVGGATTAGGAAAAGSATESGGAMNGGASGRGNVGGNNVGGNNVGGSNAGGSHVGGGSVGGAGTAGAAGGAGGASASEGGSGGAPVGGSGNALPCSDVCDSGGPACCGDGLECVREDAACVIELLDGRVTTIYEYAELEETVLALEADVELTITDSDIVRAAAGDAPTARILFELGTEIDEAHGEDLLSSYQQPFRVSCNGQVLFFGVTYMLEGAAALATPVLHFDRENDVLVARLGAIQGAWLFDEFSVDIVNRERIDRAELRGALCRRGVLEDLTEEDEP